MSTQTLDRHNPKVSDFNDQHIAHRSNTLAQLLAKAPSGLSMVVVENSYCPDHKMKDWLVTSAQLEAGLIGCPKCRSDTEARNSSFSLMRKDLLNNVGSPVEHINKGFKHFSIYGDDETKARLKKILSFSQEYSASYAHGHANILLSGTTGTGKTKLACLIINEIIKHRFHPSMTVLFKRSSDIQQEIKATWDRSNRNTEANIMRQLGKATVLVIDEVGEGDTGFSDNAANADRTKLSEILDQRYKNNLPTIITTNLTNDEFYQQLGDRATDRLRQNLVEINCVWDSYRWANQKIQTL